MSTGKVLLGVIAGLAAGAVLGILFAPDKGSNTRNKFTKTGEDFIDGMKTKFEEYLRIAKEKLSDAEDEANEMMNKGESKVQDFKRDVKNTMS